MDTLGNYADAAFEVSCLGRSLWEYAFNRPCQDSGQSRTNHVVVDESRLLTILNAKLTEAFGNPPSDCSRRLLNSLLQSEVGLRLNGNEIRVPLRALQPIMLARELLREQRPDHELRYFTMRGLRRAYHCVLSSELPHVFHILADALNMQLSRRQESDEVGNESMVGRAVLRYTADVLTPLNQALRSSVRILEPDVDFVGLFLECCRAVNYVQASYWLGSVVLLTNHIDADYLISRLFGMPTDIDGFDDLFGGGGLMLVDGIEWSKHHPIGGRAVLTLGRYGTGKSLLSLRIAFEVARKGGVAWVMPLEQSPAECLYAMETTCHGSDDGSMVIAADLISARRVLEEPQGDRGALIFLRTIKESFDQFAEAFTENVNRMERYPFRLIVVDPVNAILRDSGSSYDLRAKTIGLFEEAKRKGTNVWLVAEEGSDRRNESLYEQNIADTVVHLSLEERHGYTQRYLEVRKSRLQREQRGRHSFSIQPGKGIRVFPSSAAVSARIRSRSVQTRGIPVRYGLGSLDEILGNHAISSGDVIVLQGAPGTLKTHLGLVFLLHKGTIDKETESNENQVRHLLVTTRETDLDVKHLLESNVLRPKAMEFRKNRLLRICSLPGGYVVPGHVLQIVENEFLDAHLVNQSVDRVMMDNVAHWEMSCPFIREDKTFADTLVDLLRRRGATSLFACGETTGDSILQRSIVANADCLIHLDRIEFRGVYRVIFRVLKTRGMCHRDESFELVLRPESIEVQPTSSLLRVGLDGKVTPVKVRLFLNSGSEAQKEYNEDLRFVVQSVLSPDVEIETRNRRNMCQALSLGASSSVDELQVLQFDEFQLPYPKREACEDSTVRVFPISSWNSAEWDDLLPRLKRRVRLAGRFIGVPYYENVSLLVYRRDIVSEKAVTSWEGLACACQDWENRNQDPQSVFFDFPETQAENYNCLFFEILLSLRRPPRGAKNSRQCGLREWLAGADAVEASKIYWRICRRSYLCRPEKVRQIPSATEPLRVNPQAAVWRVWYSTLNELVASLPANVREDLVVSPLPGDIAIGGEWFLSVPKYSAAPDAALDIIKLLSTYQAELDRFAVGMGLPTRMSFYRSETPFSSSHLARYFSFNVERLAKIVNEAFTRSSLDCYQELSGLLSSHLQVIIDLPDEQSIERQAPRILESLDL